MKKNNKTKVKYIHRDGSVHYGFIDSYMTRQAKIKIDAPDGSFLLYRLDHFNREKDETIAIYIQI